MSAARTTEGVRTADRQGEGASLRVQLWTNCSAATMAVNAEQSYGLVEDAALVVEGDTLAWVGPRAALPAEWRER